MPYIDRDKAVSYFENHRRIGLHKDDIVAYLSSLPTADVEEVKHGEWIRGGIWGDTGSVEYKCSVCRETTYDADLLPRCPHCGAKMDGGKE